eukprot:scaffold87455_cov28-Tisochrysis_lutea.AAC.3
MLCPSQLHLLIGHDVSVPNSRHASRARCPSDIGGREHSQGTHEPCVRVISGGRPLVRWSNSCHGKCLQPCHPGVCAAQRERCERGL